jgi:hypothetical protein
VTFIFFGLLNSTLDGAVKISIIRKFGLVHNVEVQRRQATPESTSTVLARPLPRSVSPLIAALQKIF